MKHLLRADLLIQNPKLSHGFFGKRFGLCKDLAFTDQEAFLAISRELGTTIKSLRAPNQAHTAAVHVLRSPQEPLPEGDALITMVPGLFIGVFTADCVPILLTTEEGNMVAAIHAGWRGAFSGIIENTVNTMRTLGARAIRAALGPCIWQDSYEVSEDFYKACPAPSFFKKALRPAHWFFDLPGFVQEHLTQSGVSFIERSPANTYGEHDHFYSFRRSTHNPQETLLSNFSAIGITPNNKL